MLGPAPGVELGLVPRPHQGDLLVAAGEARGEPLLLLPAVAPAPGVRPQIRRQLVGVPAGALGDHGDRADAGLLVELAQRRRRRVLACVDAALRHLPPCAGALGLGGSVGAPPDPHLAGAVQHHDAHAGPVGGRIGRHAFRLSARSGRPVTEGAWTPCRRPCPCACLVAGALPTACPAPSGSRRVGRRRRRGRAGRGSPRSIFRAYCSWVSFSASRGT